MKLKRLGALLLTMTMCFLTSCSNPASADESSAENAVIRVGVSGDFYPFCYQENDQLKGFEVDMWDYIAEQNGWEVEYTVADFSGLFGMLDTGRIDTVAGRPPRTTRPDGKNISSRTSISTRPTTWWSAPTANWRSLRTLKGRASAL